MICVASVNNTFKIPGGISWKVFLFQINSEEVTNKEAGLLFHISNKKNQFDSYSRHEKYKHLWSNDLRNVLWMILFEIFATPQNFCRILQEIAR